MLKHNLVELGATDDLGNTAAHLAIFHDSPRLVVETPFGLFIPGPNRPFTAKDIKTVNSSVVGVIHTH